MKVKPRDIDIIKISRLIVKLFRYSKDGLDKEEREELADELTDIVVDLLSHKY